MGLNKNRIRARHCIVLIGLFAVLGCGQQSSTRPAPEPNVGPAGPSTAPASGGKAPAK